MSHIYSGKYFREALKDVIIFALVYASSKALIRVAMGTTFIFGRNLIVKGYVQGTFLAG